MTNSTKPIDFIWTSTDSIYYEKKPKSIKKSSKNSKNYQTLGLSTDKIDQLRLKSNHYRNKNEFSLKFASGEDELRPVLQNSSNSEIESEFSYTNENTNFDLYKSTPNISYIKLKYNMYLDWLNENSVKNTKNGQVQLNWYNYEKSVNPNSCTNSQETLQYLENIGSFKRAKNSTPPSEIKRSTNRHNLKNNAVNRETPSLDPFAGKSNKILKSYENKSIEQVTTQIPRLQTNPNSNPPSQTGFASKGVKFNNINPAANPNYSFSFASSSVNQHPIKPILKNLNQVNSDYYNASTYYRRSSIGSNHSSQCSDKNSNVVKLSNLKLPPIARCSDDFYAVLHDMEKETC